jgi:hypothetical protein
MKRMLLALTLALLVSVSLSVSAASASHTNGAGPNKDLVVGTGKFSSFGGFSGYFHVNAQSGPAGENPRGHFTVRLFNTDPEIDVMGEVECLAVRDNRSVVFGVAAPNKAGDLQWLVFLWIDDNREAKEPNDTGTFIFFSETTPVEVPACSEIRNNLLGTLDFIQPTDAFDQGNFIVHDATP